VTGPPDRGVAAIGAYTPCHLHLVIQTV